MRPLIQQVSNEADFNWQVAEYSCNKAKDGCLCPWHYHCEYELVLYRGKNDTFEGNYFAGDFIGNVTHNTCALYGPGLPHMVSGRIRGTEQEPHETIVLWFTQEWVDSIIEMAPEFVHLKSKLARSGQGVLFSPETGEKIYQLLSKSQNSPRHIQLIKVMECLVVMAEDMTTKTLSASNYSIQQNSNEDPSFTRVNAARKFIESNYQKPLKVKDFCDTLHMSESSAYRLFEKHFKQSFSEHLKSFRIGKACELLVNTQVPIALVAEKAGFNNLSNFNRQFKDQKSMTPSQFRSQFAS